MKAHVRAKRFLLPGQRVAKRQQRVSEGDPGFGVRSPSARALRTASWTTSRICRTRPRKLYRTRATPPLRFFSRLVKHIGTASTSAYRTTLKCVLLFRLQATGAFSELECKSVQHAALKETFCSAKLFRAEKACIKECEQGEFLFCYDAFELPFLLLVLCG